LTELISDKIGDVAEWITNLTNLRELAAWSTDEDFVNSFIAVKRARKQKL
jgi:glucan phosphorylase